MSHVIIIFSHSCVSEFMFARRFRLLLYVVTDTHYDYGRCPHPKHEEIQIRGGIFFSVAVVCDALRIFTVRRSSAIRNLRVMLGNGRIRLASVSEEREQAIVEFPFFSTLD